MKGNSDTYPDRFKRRNGKTHFRYNIESVEKQDMEETRQSYDYDYIVIEGEITRSKLIDGIISDKYTKDAEIALINNEIASPGTQEYADYQALRTHAKEIANEVLP